MRCALSPDTFLLRSLNVGEPRPTPAYHSAQARCGCAFLIRDILPEVNMTLISLVVVFLAHPWVVSRFRRMRQLYWGPCTSERA